MKAEIANSLSARCAGACPFARTEVRRRKRRTAGGKERASFPQKMGRKKRKEGTFRKKVHKFLFDLSLCSKNETFLSQKIRQFETKLLLLRLIKHNFPFIPPHCGVHIAQSRVTFPDPPAQALFDLLNHRDFALSLPIETAPKDAVPPNRETFARLRHAPWALYGLGCTEWGLYRNKEEQRPVFLPQERGTRLLWPTRFGQVHSFLVLPPCGESDHHYLIFGGFLFEKESPKSYSKGLRAGFSCRFEV